MKRAKPFYTSKTFWAAVFTIALSAVDLAGALPAAQPYLPYLMFASGVLTVAFRTTATQPLTIRRTSSWATSSQEDV